VIGNGKKRPGKRGTAWSTVVESAPDPATGQRRQKRFTATTKRELDAKVAAHIHAAETGSLTNAGKLTVALFFNRWLHSIEASIRPSTHRRYSDMVRLHVLPSLGATPLPKLSPLDLQRLYSSLKATGLSPTTIASLHYVIHRALKQAVRWDLVARNVCDAMDPPRRTTPESLTWDTKQTATFLASATEDDVEALWRLALLTGMRRGEILGLRWQDVDLDRGDLAVRRTCSLGKGGAWEFGLPKSAKSRRSIALPDSVVVALRKHRVHQLEHRLVLGDAYVNQDLVFTNGFGSPLHPNTLTNRFKKLTAKAGLPTIRFHDLRHTSATLMLANGEHPKVVQERLGHADIGMTLNLSSHVTPGMQRAAADRLDTLIDEVS
jgi:integrase